jgi:uncharacterized protein YhaN
MLKCFLHKLQPAAGPMEKLHSLPKLVLDSEEARSVQQQYDHLIVEMDQFEKATVEVIAFQKSMPTSTVCTCPVFTDEFACAAD